MMAARERCEALDRSRMVEPGSARRKDTTMNVRKITALAVVLALATGTVAFAGKKAGKGRPKLTPEEMMAAWEKAGAPGDQHKFLGELAGNFSAAVKHWIAAGEPATESKGTSTNELILGGRFLRQTYKGDFRGKPIEPGCVR
jgi:hypothetical protein